MSRRRSVSIAANTLALVALAVLVAVVIFQPTPPAGTSSATASPRSEPASQMPGGPASATPTPRNEATPRPEPSSTPTPRAGASEPPIVFTNPDGPQPGDYPGDGYPFVELARQLPTFAGIWVDRNQSDFHVAVTEDVDGAIAALRDGIPRGITVYFHIHANAYADLDTLLHRIIEDRDDLLAAGIVLSSGGTREIENRVFIAVTPFNPESVAFLQARYVGPIHFEPAGVHALRHYEPPDLDDVRIDAIRRGDDLGLVTCGRRPFPPDVLSGAPIDLQSGEPEVGALREALDVYTQIYGDLSTLGWVLAERDDYGATFVADRGDTLWEAPVFASTDGWVPGVIDYCVPRELTSADGGDANWYLDPDFPAPGADAVELHILVEEQACSGASSPAARLLPPVVNYTNDRVALTIRVRGVGGPATCPGNPRLPVTVVLPEPLGKRDLDGYSTERY